MKDTGDIIYRKQATGRLIFQRTGEASMVDFGNVRMHKHTANIERTKTSTAKKGYVVITDERPAQIEHRWTVGLDEELPDFTRLALLAGAGVEKTQAAVAVAATMDITASKKGQIILVGYDVNDAPFGVQDLLVVTVQDDEVTPNVFVEGTDYLLDKKAGLITILPSGGIADGTTLEIGYTAAEVKTQEHVANSEITVKGIAFFDEFDQHDEKPRARYSFPAQLFASNLGDNDGKKNSEFEVELLATGNITRRGRVDA